MQALSMTKHGEQTRLRLGVGMHIVVVIQMVTAQIREHSNSWFKALQTPLMQTD